MKTVAERWAAMPEEERRPWHEEVAPERRQYEEAMAQWKQALHLPPLLDCISCN